MNKRLATSSKLKKQILFMAISITLIWSFVVGLYLYVFTNEYKDINIEQSTKILGMFVYNFDEELKKYEELIFNLISDEDIYNNLYNINFSQDSYEQYNSESELVEALSLEIKNDDSITSIYYVQNNNNIIHSSSNTAILSDNEIQQISSSIDQTNNSLEWILPSAYNKYAFLIRDVKKTDFDWFNDMGTLIIAIDVNSIANYIIAYTDNLDGYYLNNEDNLVMLGNQNNGLSELSDVNLKSRNTAIIKQSGEYYLLSKYISKYNGWEYINVMNFSDIMENVFRMMFLMLGVLLLGLLATVVYGLGITDKIVSPIRALTLKANKATEGEYETDDLKKPKANDEISILEYDFNEMMKNIDQLINENFVQQMQSKDYQYKMLQAQINPHLLYNSLEIISWRARINGDRETAEIVYALGKLLRNSINTSDMIIPISQEIKILEYYIKIEKHRYEERLNINLNIQEEHLNNTIPKLTIQPIIENSIKYGVEQKVEGATIDIFSRERGGRLEIIVKDDGIGMPKDVLNKLLTDESQSKGSGIGLKNIHNRIKNQYGEKYGLEINSKSNEGTTVKIILPLEAIKTNY